MLIGISGKIGSGKDTLAMILQALTMDAGTRWYDSPIEYAQSYEGRPNFKGGAEIRKFAATLKQFVSILTGCKVNQLEDQDFKNSLVPAEWNRTVKEAREWLILRNYTHGEHVPIAHLDDAEVTKIAKERGFVFERTYRDMLQEIGTNIMRQHFHPNTWINATFSTWKPSSFLGTWKNNPNAIHEEKYPDWIISDMRFPDEAKAIKDRGGILVRINRYPQMINHDRSNGPVPVPFDVTNPKHMDLWKGECSRQHASETALDNYDGFDVIISNDGTLEELLDNVEKLITQINLKK